MTHERHFVAAAAVQGRYHRSFWGVDCSNLPYCLRTREPLACKKFLMIVCQA